MKKIIKKVDNELGFRTSPYDYWDDYKNWLKQLRKGIKKIKEVENASRESK